MIWREKTKWKFVDIHCHILPRADDGAADCDEALEMMKQAYQSGITHIIATPHYKEGIPNISPSSIMKKIHSLQEEAERQEIFVSVYPGNEIFYFDAIEKQLEAKRVCSLNGGNHLLVEFLPSDSFIHIRNAVIRITGFGYIPIVAHVERYLCMVRHPEYVSELHELGAEIQINTSSVTGSLGHNIRQFTSGLLREQLVDYLGTDAHDSKRRTPDVSKCMKRLCRKYQKEYVDRISHLNALELLESSFVGVEEKGNGERQTEYR